MSERDIDGGMAIGEFESESESERESERVALTETELPPCCLRVSPLDSSIIVVGTYMLDKQNSTRYGSIDIYKKNELSLEKLSYVNTEGAVLDLKFSPFTKNLLVSCHSTGNVMLWKLFNEDDFSLKLELLANHNLFESSNLITSISFSPILSDIILLTLTNGEVAITRLISNSGLTKPQIFQDKHNLECWTGSFGSQYALSNIIFSGGDDGCLQAHDLREPENLSIFNAKRIHDAGVVSILPSTITHDHIGDWNLSRPYDLWTGSYDDCLRTLDLRVISPMPLIDGLIPKIKTKQNLNGGVWRLIQSPLSNDDRILACCMYDGARIIDINDEGNPKITKKFKKNHESMCYGGDWSPDGDYVVTCSFYDKIIQVWSPNLNI
ncbi:hypothetical protein PACTADRAFT_48799 [Pachysolen tannophilus NRRL Y-2460]|uniref:methylated diphthine methylhydrolase n=1 Tax=Pachysolen tannophilus NRRL Y-2460 TaxID=669874 RepID=A0A1E4TZ18_PACTA|nr:hypothetical protein PACTADRAFT_48799 [Pachysolen tannophilus NRRL Y-2460]